MLRGKDCPSFARCLTRSCAARSLASEASQRMTAWAHEGMRCSKSSVEARNAEYRSLWTGPIPQAQWCNRWDKGFLTYLPHPWQNWLSLLDRVGTSTRVPPVLATVRRNSAINIPGAL